MFSTEDVQHILAQAIEETKDRVRKQYDQVLQERYTFLTFSANGLRLTEQYENFCRFNQDHIHRKMESSQFDYMS